MRRIRFANSKKLLIINYYALRQQKQNESQEKEKVDEKPLGKSRAQGEANTKKKSRAPNDNGEGAFHVRDLSHTRERRAGKKREAKKLAAQEFHACLFGGM